MIPVVFIHFGECDYAPMVLARAQAAGNEIEFLNLDALAQRAHFFAKQYQHLSTNHHDFELACIVRWFVLNEWMYANGVPDCLYCDTDVLLFANAENEWHGDPYYYAQDFTLSLGTSGHTSFWKRAALDAFCKFVFQTYLKRDETYSELVRIYREMQAQHLSGGVSDMLLLKLFALQSSPSLRVGEMSKVRNSAVWDHNINASDNFRMTPPGAGEERHKEIEFVDGTPYGYHSTGAIVQFKSLHMQGQAKRFISDYADRI